MLANPAISPTWQERGRISRLERTAMRVGKTGGMGWFVKLALKLLALKLFMQSLLIA